MAAYQRARRAKLAELKADPKIIAIPSPMPIIAVSGCPYQCDRMADLGDRMADFESRVQKIEQRMRLNDLYGA